jgi:hypothetical protein
MQVKESLYFLASSTGTEPTSYPFVYPINMKVIEPLLPNPQPGRAFVLFFPGGEPPLVPFTVLSFLSLLLLE